MKATTFVFAIIGLAFFSSCDKEGTNSNLQTEMPAIDSLTTNSTRITYGGDDPAILKCFATGGGLNYIWEVDLGDLFVLNNEGSEVQFTASPCCIGEKTITCTVANDQGKVSESIAITITL
jgi:hypothetical protein